MGRPYAIYLCGGDFDRLDPRDPCPNSLHDWPLPAGYVDAAEVAAARLARRWSNKRCPDCRVYGWQPGADHPSCRAVEVRYVKSSD